MSRFFVLQFFATVLLCIHVNAATVTNGGPDKVRIEWGSETILLQDRNSGEPIRKTNDSRVIGKSQLDCAIGNARTRCWKLREQRKNEQYGKNLLFVRPIAIIPQINAAAATESQKVSKLPAFEFKSVPKDKLAGLLNKSQVLGQDTEAHAFTEVETTIGGVEALALWRQLLGRKPTNQECDEDYCAVVVSASRRGDEAIAYCLINGSKKLGLAIPFNCQVVAFKRQKLWYIYSYDGPEGCDGCGAAEGASCAFTTSASIDKIEEEFISAMKIGKTNITLIEDRRAKGVIVLAGKNVATNSKFFSGYYDNSFAKYSISESKDGNHRSINIDGLCNLLISAEPVSGGNDYHEIGHAKNSDGMSDVEWFQNQVLTIVKDRVVKKFDPNPDCHVDPIF
jgi:hypothetical protein